MRPRLRCDERTREVAEVLLSTRLPGRMSQPVGRVMINAGIDLLPEWAQEMLGLSLTPLQRHDAPDGAWRGPRTARLGTQRRLALRHAPDDGGVIQFAWPR